MEFGQNEGGRLCKQGLNETEEKKSRLSSPEGAQALRGEKWATESKIRGGIVRITWTQGLTVLTENAGGMTAWIKKKKNPKTKEGSHSWPLALSNVVKVTAESLEERRPTRPRVPPEVLGPGSGTPLPAGHSVVKGACHKLLLIKLHRSTSVGLDAINTLPCAHIPQFCRQVIWPFKRKTGRLIGRQTLRK